MADLKGYHRLIIVDKLKSFVKYLYEITEEFPKSEIFGLTSQLRRASVSVLLNIVEGDRRKSAKEFFRFLEIADASLAEVEISLELANHLNFLNQTDYSELETKRKEIVFMLVALMKKVKTNIK